MKNINACILILLTSAGTFAGTATFTGNGVSTRDPEFVSVNVTVQSECYATPKMAMAANNETVGAIQSFLETLLVSDSPVDTVRTQGGTTAPFSRSYYHEGLAVTVCSGTFQQSTNLLFKTVDLAHFSETFAVIQEKLLSSYQQGGQENDQSVTFVSIQQPSAGLCQETRRQMQQEALARAEENAIEQFKVTAATCGIRGLVEITSVGEKNDSYNASAAYAGGAPGHERNVAISFDSLSESRSINLTFNFPLTSFDACVYQEYLFMQTLMPRQPLLVPRFSP